MEFVQRIFDFITTAMSSGLYNRANNIITNVVYAFSMGFTIYMLYVIWDFYQRGVDASLMDFTRKVFGWLLIIAIAFNGPNYQTIATYLYELPESLVGWINGTPMDAKYFTEMVTVINQNISNLQAQQDSAGWATKVLIGISMGIVMLLGYGGLFLTIGMYLIAKASLAVILTLGPIFIGFLLFSNTRQWGMNWISQILNYSITIGLYSIIIVIQQDTMKGLKLTNKVENHWFWGESTAVNLGDIMNFTLAIIAISAILIPVIMSIPSIASALVGGASASSQTGGFGRMAMAGATGAGTGAGAVLSRGAGMALRSANWTSGGTLGKAGNALINSGLAHKAVGVAKATKGFFRDGGGRRLCHKSALEKSRMNNPSN
ncbi:type IV secretion system protein [Taylorella equigenitalis]|uniref:type IV secretion system protein n=1 Tax=Taylorella equigenitalis TaxID=29575 RepID=UPI0004235033|nr:type IV secretion system protein [Taylorella equigenitalis]ASY42538.1 hypothetical protein CA943_05415 [Taylorella equigenitalis]KGK34107.1 membrane protein [Taylorella equigenitalis]WDU45964.1 type IV secretion system protein [Taylorella equigenitalis]